MYDKNDVYNSTKRSAAYKLFIYSKCGHLGKGNRIRIADCVVNKFRQRYPEVDENYTGFNIV